MISWTKIDDDRYIIRNGPKTDTVDVAKLIVFSLVLGINIDEIQYALLEMNKLDNDYAEFGMNKTFIASKKLI